MIDIRLNQPVDPRARKKHRRMVFGFWGLLVAVGALILLLASAREPRPVPVQPSISSSPLTLGPAPAGPALSIAATAIEDADHPCGRVVLADRLNDGGIRATCANGEVYRVFTANPSGSTKVYALRCAAASQLGVSGC